jgi:predicted DNA-binding WGR domain protein
MICVDISKNKQRFYYLALTVSLFNIVLVRAWGRIGNQTRVKEEWYDDMESALTQANRIFRQKCTRGYVEVKDFTSFKWRVM